VVNAATQPPVHQPDGDEPGPRWDRAGGQVLSS